MSFQSSSLSQEEVDALLAGINGEAFASIDGEQRTDPSGIRAYDLTAPDRVVRHRMQTLELINERFVRRLRPAMFGFMRRNADITVNPPRIIKYAEFERNLPVPSNLNMIAIKPLRGTALFTFDPNLVFLVIDGVFGGHGRYRTRVEGRDFTSTEQRIIRRLLSLALESYAGAWELVYRIDPEYVRSEMHTKFASIANSNEIVVVSTFNIELGASGGKLNVCLPYAMIEPLRDLLVRPPQSANAETTDLRWTRRLSHEVRNTYLDVVAEFASIDSSVGRLLDMKVGDLLPIDLPDQVTAHVGGVPVMTCSYGTSRDRYALRVEQILINSSNDLK